MEPVCDRRLQLFVVAKMLTGGQEFLEEQENVEQDQGLRNPSLIAREDPIEELVPDILIPLQKCQCCS
ncbi:hypothetical protein TNCV_4274771 [Trichonephila clavipes]|nr:hypothetical protein TNCV_4274771 [Trichonephila clavipes]